MQVVKTVKALLFSEDGHQMKVSYDNRGEPFRDGVEFSFSSEREFCMWVLLDFYEVRKLRDKLNEFLGAESASAGMKSVCEFLGFDPTNHHNAAKCPYCTKEPVMKQPAIDNPRF